MDIEALKYDEKGLIPAIIQDANSGKVLMLAYMNNESLKKSLETGYTWFYSRSRNELWNKGATSGHYQRIVEIKIDCDNDALLIKVIQTGNACHTGEYSCFFNVLKEFDKINTISEKVFILQEIYEVIMERKKMLPENSYVAKKMKEGIDRILKKVGEEAGELIIAVKNNNKEEIAWEMADLLFHLWMVLGYLDLTPDIVYDKLLERRK